MLNRTIYHIALAMRKLGIPVGKTHYERNLEIQQAATQYFHLMAEMSAKRKELLKTRCQCDIRLQELISGRMFAATAAYDIAVPGTDHK